MEGWTCIVLILGPAVLTTSAGLFNATSTTNPIPAATPSIITDSYSPTGTTESTPPLTVPRTTPNADPYTNQSTTTFNNTIIAPEFTTLKTTTEDVPGPHLRPAPEPTTAWPTSTTLSPETAVSSTTNPATTTLTSETTTDQTIRTSNQASEYHTMVPKFTSAEGSPTPEPTTSWPSSSGLPPPTTLYPKTNPATNTLISTNEPTAAWLTSTTLSPETAVFSTTNPATTFNNTTTSDSQVTPTSIDVTKETTSTASPSTTAGTTAEEFLTPTPPPPEPTSAWHTLTTLSSVPPIYTTLSQTTTFNNDRSTLPTTPTLGTGTEGLPSTLSLAPEPTVIWSSIVTASTTLEPTSNPTTTPLPTTVHTATLLNQTTAETSNTAHTSSTTDLITADLSTTEPTEITTYWSSSETDPPPTATQMRTTTTLWSTEQTYTTDSGTTMLSTSIFPSDHPNTTAPVTTTTTYPTTLYPITTTTHPPFITNTTTTTAATTTLWSTEQTDTTDSGTTMLSTSIFPSDHPNTTAPVTTTTTYPTSPDPFTTTTHPPFTTTNPPNTNTTTPSTTTTLSTTSTNTTPTLTTAAPLNCSLGKPVGSICICPDEWTGETCSEKNFCYEKTLEGFSFPNTTIGWFAYSDEKCPEGTSGAGTSRASTRCSITDGTPQFDQPRVFECEQTLSDIQGNLTTSADLETLASSTQLLTSRPEGLRAENITVAADIVNTLLLSPNATESVRVAAVATISQLLNATESVEIKESNTTQSLTLTLDELSLNLSLTSNVSQLVQPNLVVQSAQIQASDTQGVQFTALAGLSGSFVTNRIQLNTNVSKVTVDSGFIADALVYIRFPSDGGAPRSQQQSNVSLGFVLYQNSRFFPSSLYRRRRANIRVLSASIGGPNGSARPESVELQFRPSVPDNTSLHDFSCVFWDYMKKDWNTSGCTKGNASDGLLRCSCNHTTNFAALWSFRENYKYTESLRVVSIVGLSFSILGLVVTIIHHLKENFQRKSRKKQTKLNSKMSLLCIYLSLLAFIITFLSGVQNPSADTSTEVEPSVQNQILDSDLYVKPDRGSCTAVAALLHFFLLATFSWNSVYSTQLVLLVRSMQRSLPSHWTPLSLGVGWGVPAVVTSITLAATYRVENPLGYRQEEFCWLAALDANKHFSFGKPMFWAFLLPLGLVLIYNTVLLVLTSMTTCRVDPKLTSTKSSSLTKKFLVSFSLVVLLGLSWTLGYFVLVTTGTAHLVFSILFCLCTTTQGFQIFILFTARTPSFKASMRRSIRYISTSIPLKTRKYNLWKNWRETSTSETYRDITDQDTSI